MTGGLRQAALCLSLAAVPAAPRAAAAAADPCRHSILASIASADGAWRAELDEAVCEGGLAGAIVDSVRLTPAAAPAQQTELLGVQTGGRAEERPRLAWAGPDILQVTVPNYSFLKVLRRQLGPIRVAIRFDPADPAARAAWLRRLGLPADAPG